MTEMILVRHGETDWNRELRFQGHVDVGLNAIGLEQARRLASRLAAEPAAHLYASDLLRAQQTAQPVADQLGVPSLTEPALREQSFGTVDGMRVDDIKAQHPQAWEQWLRFHEDFCMPGGETAREFHARVVDAVYRIAGDHPGATLVVVTHGGVLDMIWRTARSLSLSGPRQSEIPNAGVSRVRVSAGRIEVLAWADTAHLADLPPQPVYDQLKLVAELPPAR
ncbi:MAG TPA: histidine phosphatase family protein [Ramlibacter sp.]